MLSSPFRTWLVLPLYLAAIALPLSLMVGTGMAYHSCNLETCGGAIDSKTDNEIPGASGLLRWRSINRLEHPARVAGEPDYRCYEREVKNESGVALTDIYWKVANFYRRILPANTAACEPTPARGEPEQRTGPIVFGPTNTPVAQTRVWMPKYATALYHFLGPSELKPGNKVAFGGSFRFYSSSDKNSVGTVRVTSTVEIVGPSDYRYIYKIESKSAERIKILWGALKDVAQLRDESKDFVLSSKIALAMGRERTLTFVHPSKVPPKWGTGTVIVKDEKGGVLAKGTATSIGPETGSIVEPE